MKANRNHEVVDFFGNAAALRTVVYSVKQKIAELQTQMDALKIQLTEEEELLQMVEAATEIVDGIAIRVYVPKHRNGLNVHVNAVSHTPERWAEAYQQVNSENEWGVQLNSNRAIYNQGLTKEEAVKIAKDWVTGKFNI